MLTEIQDVVRYEVFRIQLSWYEYYDYCVVQVRQAHPTPEIPYQYIRYEYGYSYSILSAGCMCTRLN